MNEVNDRIWDEFDRDKRKIEGFTFEEDSSRFVSPIEVLKAHYAVIEFASTEGESNGVGGVGPRSFELLLSAVDRQSVSLGEKYKWESLYERISTLVFGIVKNHPFFDANKRTAMLTAVYALYEKGYYIEVEKNELEDIIVYIADSALHNFEGFEGKSDDEDDVVRFFSKYIERNVRKIDVRMYTITYRELRTKLRGYGYELKNPYKNHIDIERISDSKRVAHIGFPGWTRQVAKGDIKKIRETLNLTEENGVDSEVFFRDTEPVFAFVGQYRSQLLSLAQR